MRKITDYLSLTLRGICMGAADVVPGVSGGTIAFLTGIYTELLNSIKSIDGEAVKMLLKLDLKGFWKHINGNFLVAVFAGILISVFSLAKLMKYLLAEHPISIWSFFFGLIIASSIYVLRELDKLNWQYVVSLLVGVGIAAYICLVSPSETPDALWFIFISGMIGICAMILPGISGSFILLLLGKYEYIMTAVTEFNIPVLVVFAVGALIGIILFSHLPTWLLKRFYNLTVCLLSGFMIGSLIKVWPWKEALDSGVDVVISPSRYAELTAQPAQVWNAVIFAIVGVALVFVIEFIVVKMKSKSEK